MGHLVNTCQEACLPPASSFVDRQRVIYRQNVDKSCSLHLSGSPFTSTLSIVDIQRVIYRS